MVQASIGTYFLEVTALRCISVFHLPLLVVLASPQEIVCTHPANILLKLELEKRTSENAMTFLKMRPSSPQGHFQMFDILSMHNVEIYSQLILIK